MASHIHIDKCLTKYKELFTLKDNTQETSKSDIDKEICIKEKYNEFERFFFIEMNNALFAGEYLEDDYIKKIETFENDVIFEKNLIIDDNVYPAIIRGCLKELKEIVFSIQNKIKLGNEDLLIAFATNEYLKTGQDNNYKYFGAWCMLSLGLLYIDHTLINNREYREVLITFFHKIQLEINGLANEELVDVFEKLRSKCSFLLRKIFIYDKKKSLHYSVDYEIKNVDEIIKDDIYNEDFISLFDGMYLDRYDMETVSYYKDKFVEEQYSCIGFIVLAYYYRISDSKDINRLDKLCACFDEYYKKVKENNPCKYDRYAMKSIKNYIHNCRFSYALSQKEYTILQLTNDIKDIERIQEETEFKNYHPYKKALTYLDNYFSQNNGIENVIDANTIELFNDIFEKYKTTYKVCLQKRFSPFQLIIKDSTTEKGVFIASSFSKPISPSKLKESEREFRDTKQYLKIKGRLSKWEKEISVIAADTKNFRRESFEYLGVFIAVITFLFGSIQLFGKESKTLSVTITNIVSLGIVLGIFMAMLYIVLYCKRNRIWLLLGLIVFSLLVLILFNIYVK